MRGGNEGVREEVVWVAEKASGKRNSGEHGSEADCYCLMSY